MQRINITYKDYDVLDISIIIESIESFPIQSQCNDYSSI